MMRRIRFLTALLTLFALYLVGYGFLPPVRQARRNQALFRAIHANDVGGVRKALADGADPNASHVPQNWQELDAPLWKRLWRQCRGVRYPRQNSVHALYDAVCGWYDPAAGHWVSLPENTVLVAALLDAGANPATRGDMPILCGAAEEARPRTVQLLLERGADVNLGNGHGTTSLMWAATSGDPATVRTLLDSGADVNQRDADGATALFWASSLYPVVHPPNKRADVARLLLERGADSRFKNSGGMTALMVARRDLAWRPANASLPPLIALLERHR